MGLKRGELSVDPRGHVGVAEMGHERDLLHLRAGHEACIRGLEALRAKAQAVHARIHFEKNPVWLMGFVAHQPIDLGLTVHGVPQFEPRALFELARIKNAFEQ